jgi:SAM-dependent MidA family methyltransferase
VGEEGGHLVEVLVPAAPELVEEAQRFAPDAPEGGRIPLQHRSREWLRQALATVERGRVVLVDYADATPSMARRPWNEWVRTYRSHGRGGHPLDGPGTQDVTCEVAVDQLARVRPLAADRSQAEFLQDDGIVAFTAEARAAWEERAHIGDLQAMKARSLVNEAAALTDPTGLGAFRVLEWTV